MHSQMHYLPLAPGFFAILVGFFFIVLILRSVRYAYESLGVSSNTAIFLPLPATLRQQLGALVLCFVTGCQLLSQSHA